MFSCEFCEISKNTFFYITPPVAATEATPFNPCLVTALFLYPLKTSKNLLFYVFKEHRKTSGMECVKAWNRFYHWLIYSLYFFSPHWHIYNSFHVTGFLLYPPEDIENLWFSDVFRGYSKRPVALNGLSKKKFKSQQ